RREFSQHLISSTTSGSLTSFERTFVTALPCARDGTSTADGEETGRGGQGDRGRQTARHPSFNRQRSTVEPVFFSRGSLSPKNESLICCEQWTWLASPKNDARRATVDRR